VSEEFTSLPALSLVLIGFALFLVVLGQTYLTFQERGEQLRVYQTANTLAEKLTNPACGFMKSGGLLDIPFLRNDSGTVQTINEQWRRSGLRCLLRVHWNQTTEEFPSTNETIGVPCVAVSYPIGVYLSDARTVPGTLTVLVWRVPG
jgi:hypothetical protein